MEPAFLEWRVLVYQQFVRIDAGMRDRQWDALPGPRVDQGGYKEPDRDARETSTPVPCGSRWGGMPRWIAAT